jgi:hypothetical protein
MLLDMGGDCHVVTFFEISQTAVVMYKWLNIASAGRWMTWATSPAPMMPTRSLLSAIANDWSCCCERGSLGPSYVAIQSVFISLRTSLFSSMLT